MPIYGIIFQLVIRDTSVDVAAGDQAPRGIWNAPPDGFGSLNTKEVMGFFKGPLLVGGFKHDWITLWLWLT